MTEARIATCGMEYSKVTLSPLSALSNVNWGAAKAMFLNSTQCFCQPVVMPVGWIGQYCFPLASNVSGGDADPGGASGARRAKNRRGPFARVDCQREQRQRCLRCHNPPSLISGSNNERTKAHNARGDLPDNPGHDALARRGHPCLSWSRQRISREWPGQGSFRRQVFGDVAARANSTHFRPAPSFMPRVLLPFRRGDCGQKGAARSLPLPRRSRSALTPRPFISGAISPPAARLPRWMHNKIIFARFLLQKGAATSALRLCPFAAPRRC